MKTKHDTRSRRQRAAAPPTMPPRQEGDATSRAGDVEGDADFLTTVSKRLVVVTLIMLGMTVALFLIPLFLQNRFPLSWFCFGVGIIGGFVSIQQRLKLLSPEELALLARSWVHILVILLFGGIFALVLYLLVLARRHLGGCPVPDLRDERLSRGANDKRSEAILPADVPRKRPRLRETGVLVVCGRFL